MAMCEPKNETGLCVCSEPRDGLPWVDPTELPYLDDAVGPSKGQPRCGRKAKRDEARS
jgi:hypothetical protein